jgi:hypothetical protein
VLTPDWRVGVISPSGSSDGRGAINGFNNGVIFFCGLCRPAYPPFVQYPVFTEIPPGAGEAEIAAAVGQMTGNGVQLVYVAPGAESGALLEALSGAGLKLIGSLPPPASLQDQWAASIRVDAASAVMELWPSLLAGEGGISIDTPVVITDRNPGLFSPGRQRLVENLLKELLAGSIDTGIDPQTGEPRP